MAANISTTMSNWSSTAGSNQPDSTDLASTLREDLQAIQAAVATVFPGMAGAAWRKQTKTGDYPLAATDNMSIISCTNATLATITATAATVGAAFMCIVRSDSTTGFVVVGSTKYTPGTAVLVLSDGSAISQVPINGGETLLHYEDIGTASSIDVTGLTASNYVGYRVHLRNFSMSSGTATLSMRSGSGSVDTGARYVGFRHVVDAAANHTVAGAAGQTSIVLSSVSTTGPANLWAELSISATALVGEFRTVGHDGTNWFLRNAGGVYVPASGTPDRIQFLIDAGSFGAGQLFVWGVR